MTDRDFDKIVEQSTVPVLVEFWKPGCGSCRALMRELEKLELDVRRQGPDPENERRGEFPDSSGAGSSHHCRRWRSIAKEQFERFIGGLGTREEILKQLRLT